MSEHISVEELADAAEGLLEPARADAVHTHLGFCAICQETTVLLTSVTQILASEPAPAMPSEVAARLDGVLADEQARREIKADLPAAVTDAGWAPRQHLDLPPPPRAHHGRAVGWILAAAGIAALVGLGGYVISARAGLNEPPNGAAAISSGDLHQQAGELEASGTVDPHRFSRAWSCAREATDDRITGIASVTVDGSPALLVFLRTSSGPQAWVVEGCDDGRPRVTETTRLSR